ncbi:GAP family protein [Streptomyces lunaelactis]|uniref:GAP family protein n=1 Tax=Streptomyces lunaelactis TaxID=1535768 RepID=UPI0020C7A4C4|nr:GAP family protein [Streptomyces lunaelactis]
MADGQEERNGRPPLRGVRLPTGELFREERRRAEEKIPRRRRRRTPRHWHRRSSMDLKILPLAVTMMVGPQIMSAIIFVTAPRAVRASLAFLVGIAAGTTAGVALMRGIAALLGHAVDTGSTSGKSSAGHIIEYVLVGLLVFIAAKNWVGRRTAEPPKWLKSLMTAGPRKAFTVGLLLVLLMPSDLVVMLTVGVHLQHHDAGLGAALPFIGLTVLIAALPLLARLLFGKRAERAMPGVREWMNTHSWLISIIACGIFIALILSEG